MDAPAIGLPTAEDPVKDYSGYTYREQDFDGMYGSIMLFDFLSNLC